MEDKVAALAISKYFQLNPLKAYKLWAGEGGSWEGALNLASNLGMPPSALSDAARELEKAECLGVRYIPISDEDYPALLRECTDPPIGIYLKSGSSPAEIFSLRPAVAIVGTRDMSPYGREWCERIVDALSMAELKPVIVSGLAFGIDSVAHRRSLERGLPTIAVMATGPEEVYPFRHRSLAASIASSPGSALLTSYPMGSQPVAVSFLCRNRIIAGLSRAVIVIESKKKGGSLVTAKYAIDYDREVYALPGRLGDLRSMGCNSLIRTSMAELIADPEDLVERLGLRRSRARRRVVDLGQDALSHYLETNSDGQASKIVDVLLTVRSNAGITAEGISRLTALPLPEAISICGLLESDGYITMDILQRFFVK
ncbi:MAG: DNA-processing protein DprA [Bacteroidales bacterium]|nr:DNA-processing protein DprA [Bacteroidales bacterium]